MESQQLLLIILALLTYFRAGSVPEVAGRPFGWFDLAALARVAGAATRSLNRLEGDRTALAILPPNRGDSLLPQLEPPRRHARAPEG